MRQNGEYIPSALIGAKANNVKGVRVGLRSETILEKIEAAGLSYNP